MSTDVATTADPLHLPTAHGEPPVCGRLRSCPEDFVVDEVLGFEPDDAGSHVLLVVEKRGANTGWVGSQLARAAGVAVRDVGWSGQKDRNAVTRQAYTLPWPLQAPVEPCLAFAGDGFRVLSARLGTGASCARAPIARTGSICACGTLRGTSMNWRRGSP